jgi:anaerobic dimethyl sulfoxide reductase subunit A
MFPGITAKYSEYGKTCAEVAKWCYEQTQKKYPDQLPADYNEFKKRGIVRVVANRDKGVALADFRKDPVKNKLSTPSGKIEIYSERLQEIADTWQLKEGDVITALPQYVESWEMMNDPLAAKYPLQMIGFQHKGRTHSTYDNCPWLNEVAPTSAWINPVDAQKRGIKSEDKLMVFNDRGKIYLKANVTERIIPGTIAVPVGAWYTPDKASGVDTNGGINTLTSHRPSPLAKANPQHTNLVEVQKA